MGEILKQATEHNYAFWICLTISILLIVISFFIPPMAEISGSVLAAVGELFAYASLYSLIQAIRKGKEATLQHGKTSLSIGDKVPPPPPTPIEYEQESDY